MNTVCRVAPFTARGSVVEAACSRLPPMSRTRLIPRMSPTTTPTPSAIRSVFALIFPSESPRARAVSLPPPQQGHHSSRHGGPLPLGVLQAGGANFRENLFRDCLKIRDRHQSRDCEIGRRAQEGLACSSWAIGDPRLRAPLAFFRQSQKGCSR